MPAPALLAALGVVAFLCLLGPWWSVYEFDTDEGINLMKAALVARGYALYTEIWNDQPPGLTMLLAAVFDTIGPSVPAARATVLAFAGLAAWSLFRLLDRDEGPGAAWLGVAVLASSALFQKLAVAVMIGLPAVALALLSLDLALSADRRRSGGWGRVVASAVVMALSLHTKMFTATVLPAAVVAVAVAGWRGGGGWSGAALHGGGWLAVAGTATAFLAWIGGASVGGDLVAPHLDGRTVEAFRYLGGGYRLWKLLAWDGHVAALAAAGLAVAVLSRWSDRRRRWPASRVVPLVWLAVAGVVLADHRPLWDHQVLLLTVPLAWTAGLAATALTGPLRRPAAGRRWLAGAVAAALVVAAWPAGRQAARTAESFHARPVADDLAATAALAERAPATRWVLTDRPMDAFRAGLVMPPSLAVYSLKRIKAGLLPEAAVVRELRRYVPDQVSYRRFYMGEAVRAHLEAHYVRVIDLPRQTLYVVPALAGAPAGGGG